MRSGAPQAHGSLLANERTSATWQGEDKGPPIRINLTKSPSISVGARAGWGGGEGLDGRPRPVPCADMEGARDHTPSTGRPSRPSLPHIIRPRPYGLTSTFSKKPTHERPPSATCWINQHSTDVDKAMVYLHRDVYLCQQHSLS